MRPTFTTRRFLAPSKRSSGDSEYARKEVRKLTLPQVSKLKEDARQRMRKNQMRNRRTLAETDLDTFNELNTTHQSHVDLYSPEPDRITENEDLDLPGFNVDEEWVDEEADEEADEEEEEINMFLDAQAAYRKSTNKRRRRNKVVIDQRRWKEQLSAMTDGWMDYCYRRQLSRRFEGEMERFELTTVNDVYYCSTIAIGKYTCDMYKSASLIRQGYFPCNPLVHSSVVTTQTLELFHSLFLRCPRLSIQPFIRALCDLQGYRFKNYLCIQFSQAYDVFISVKEEARRQARQSLNRDSPDWRSLNACPCCQYPVKDEPKLEFGFLAAMDGNDSLKRVERREVSEDGKPGKVKERPDEREGGGGYFLSVEEVDSWERTNWKNLPGYEESPPEGTKRTPCEEKWDNMKAGHVSKEKELFKETGIFAAACRHSFVLWVADMIKSGEGRKYALAIMNRFLQASKREREEKGLSPLASDQGWAYDIGCQFRETLRRSPLKSLSVEQRVRILIGILHGYGHNRLCQLEFLLLYIFLYHHDNFEAYANLSKFIHDNYRQALEVQRLNVSVLDELKELGVRSGDDVYTWIREERQYLESRHQTPEEDTNTIELYKKLVLLKDCRARISAGRSVFINHTESNTQSTHDLERSVRQAQETELTLLGEVHFYENRLKVDQRWEEGSEDWNRAKTMADMKDYREAVDKLEGLVVARIFELSKMHMAGTGYKMRQHLGKALKTRSAAIKTAVQKVNQAGSRLTPPRDPLDYDDIVDKTYLADLDFLRETRNDVREKIWAKPHVRELVTKYFKLWKSHVELDRLHVEIKRLITYMKEERNFLKAREAQVSQYDPHLAQQIAIYRWERARFNELHRTRLRGIYKLEGFSRTNIQAFIPGEGFKRQSEEDWEEVGDNLSKERPEEEGQWEEEEEDDDDEGAAVDAVASVLGVAYDAVT
ncbi:hypothetical protein PQX77_006472 [Marasmius sp. AFHP31]|nr:hypothetical protein PQX77_006472 [Marasmius sp. AFHP31]